MNPIIRNILAVIAGAFIGSLINGGIVSIAGAIFPPPPGTDLTTSEGLKAAMPLMQPRHFIMPFLAHAVGALVGSFITIIIAASHKMKLALLVSALFLAGGIYMVIAYPAPIWFAVVDLVFAYIPMAFLAALLAKKVKK